MSVSVFKKGIRALGIAECFIKGRSKYSILAGVVMRGDGVIDGCAMAKITVGGLDATDGVLNIFRSLSRTDISVIMLNGCIIAWYNVIDLIRVHEETKVPLICVTYEESEGLEEYFRKYFPQDCEKRIEIYRRNGERVPIVLKTGYRVYVRFFGMEKWECIHVLNRFTKTGSIPEPLRVARLVAKAVARDLGADIA